MAARDPGGEKDLGVVIFLAVFLRISLNGLSEKGIITNNSPIYYVHLAGAE